MVHLLRENLLAFHVLADTADVRPDHWIAVCADSTFTEGIFVDLKRVLVKFMRPIVRLI